MNKLFLPRVIRKVKSLFNPLAHNNGGLRYVNNTDSCGLALKTLEQDTVQIGNKVRQVTQSATQPTISTAPMVFEGSQVPMHHKLHGGNCNYREAYKAATKGNPLTNEDDLFDAQCGLPYMLKIDKEFAKLPPLEKDCIVWRGRRENPIIQRFNEDFKIIDTAKIGDTIIPDTSYSYTGFTKELASFWSSSCGGRTMMYKIHLPKGAKVSRNLEHGGEVVMPRNAEYRVLSKNVKDNHIEVELEYILPKKDNVSEIEELMRKFNIEPTM